MSDLIPADNIVLHASAVSKTFVQGGFNVVFQPGQPTPAG